MHITVPQLATVNMASHLFIVGIILHSLMTDFVYRKWFMEKVNKYTLFLCKLLKFPYAFTLGHYLIMPAMSTSCTLIPFVEICINFFLNLCTLIAYRKLQNNLISVGETPNVIYGAF